MLGLLAVKMALGPGEEVVDEGENPHDHTTMAVCPLAVPCLLDPVGVTVLIIAPAEAHGIVSSLLVVVLVLLVGALDWVIFTDIDKIAKRLNPTSLVIAEVAFGLLLTAVAVQLVVSGLDGFGIIDTCGHH
ncbi:MAG: MarC family protein [Pseudomonadota bacterium]